MGGERGGAGGDFGAALQFVRPCDHAVTVSSSSVLPIQFIERVVDFPVMRAETGTRSAHSAADRLVSSPLDRLLTARYCATPGPQFVLSRSSTCLSWRRCSFPWSYCSENHRYSPVAVH